MFELLRQRVAALEGEREQLRARVKRLERALAELVETLSDGADHYAQMKALVQRNQYVRGVLEAAQGE